ncbi:hypothetical protein Rsub_12877, partial [Raphidocelis subcapitata]
MVQFGRPWHGGGRDAPGGGAATITAHTVLSVARSSDEQGLSELLLPRRAGRRPRSSSPSGRTHRAGGGPGRGGRHGGPGGGGGAAAHLGPELAALEARSGLAWLLPARLDATIALSALAVTGAAMGDPLMSLVDTAMVGRLASAPALAALGANGALYNCIFFLFFTALSVLTTRSCAEAHARGDAARFGAGFAQALAAAGAVAAGLVVLLVAAPEAVLGVFSTNEETMPAAATYLSIRALSIPAALFMCVGQAAFRSLLDL